MQRGLRKTRRLAPVLLTGLVAVHAACSSGARTTWSSVYQAIRLQYPSVRQLSTRELADWMARPDTLQPLLLDARQAEEFAVSHLRDARSAPDLQAALNWLEGAPPDVPIVAYCSVGYRSSELAARLQEEGFANVYNLEGSIFKWANEGHPVYRGLVRVRTVHPYGEPWSHLLDRSLRAAAE